MKKKVWIFEVGVEPPTFILKTYLGGNTIYIAHSIKEAKDRALKLAESFEVIDYNGKSSGIQTKP